MVMFKPLNPGDTIALIAPSGYIDMPRLEAAADSIRAAGFTPLIHPQCQLRDGRFAGSDAERVAALHAVYQDANIKAIWCVRGGYGAVRLLDKIDYSIIRAHPKPFIGLSDITALLLAIHRETGQVTFHGRMAGDVARKPCTVSDNIIWSILRGETAQAEALPDYAPEVLVKGEATGKLLGGNLATLVSMIGSPDAPDLTNTILFLEEVNEPFYRLDRLFLQLMRAKLGTPRALIIGGMTDMVDDANGTPGWNVAGIVQSHFGPLNIPIVLNYPAGHIHHQTMLPMGANVKLVAGDAVSLTLQAPLFTA